MKRLNSILTKLQTICQRSLRRQNQARLGLLLLGCGLLSTRVYGYDAVADFSTNANSSGVWTYGWATNTSGQFELMTNEQTFHPGPDAGWFNNGTEPYATYVDKNFSTNLIQNGTAEFYPDTVHMDPQSYAVFIRFTAPSNGFYQVSGLFRLQDTGTKAHYISIVLNTNITAYSESTTGGTNNSEYPFGFPCSLNQGQTVDFIVSALSGYSSLSTGLKATITPVTNTVAAYSAVANFSNTKNPDGVWSYVYWANPTFTGIAQLLNTNIYEVTGQSNVYSWWNGYSGTADTGVIISVDDATNPYPETAHPNVFYYPDTLAMDPEKLAAATRFTAPFSGVYAIQGFFRVQDSQLAASGYAATLEIITNATAASPVFVTNSLGAPLETQYPFSLNLPLNAGATVDFAVVGVNGAAINLASGINATITPANPLLKFVRLSGGNLSFAFLSVPNQGYTIQTTTSLIVPNWTTYTTGTGTGLLLTNQVHVNTGSQSQFFRISIP